MKTDKSKFAAALEALKFCVDPSQYDKHSGQAGFVREHKETIRRALLLADKVTREPSEGMIEAVPQFGTAAEVIKSAIRAAQEEIANAE